MPGFTGALSLYKTTGIYCVAENAGFVPLGLDVSLAALPQSGPFLGDQIDGFPNVEFAQQALLSRRQGPLTPSIETNLAWSFPGHGWPPTLALHFCNGVLVDVMSDRANCGACGNDCSDDDRCFCLHGGCACWAGGCCKLPGYDCGLTACGTNCVDPDSLDCKTWRCRDLQNDAKNCGSCGHVCSAGEVCLKPGLCCPQLFICGNDCCPPEQCTANGCCRPPHKICKNNCCAPDQGCVTGQCVAGCTQGCKRGQACIAGKCAGCPAGSACGDHCCQSKEACINGQCVACGGGRFPCGDQCCNPSEGCVPVGDDASQCIGCGCPEGLMCCPNVNVAGGLSCVSEGTDNNCGLCGRTCQYPYSCTMNMGIFQCCRTQKDGGLDCLG